MLSLEPLTKGKIATILETTICKDCKEWNPYKKKCRLPYPKKCRDARVALLVITKFVKYDQSAVEWLRTAIINCNAIGQSERQKLYKLIKQAFEGVME